MRLLQRKDDGGYSLIEFVGHDVPAYAILSHTWGTDNGEVTMQDFKEGIASTKAGYRKIQFCSNQAIQHGLSYFWVDTCCIDKTSSSELSEAINSMYAWYRKAAKCYVYLSDVSIRSSTSSTPMEAFKQSRWFRRGWTLQELIAPASVEFFSVEGQRLGDKYSLAQQLHDVTHISILALQGNSPLHLLTVEERMSWIGQRQTKREEDAAYSLLGIFDVFMPLLYGEGKERAFARLKKEIQAQSDQQHTPVPQHVGSTQAYNGPVFHGSISGRYVIPGTHVTGGTVNFDFRES